MRLDLHDSPCLLLLLCACAGPRMEHGPTGLTWDARSEPTRPTMWIEEEEDSLRIRHGDELFGVLNHHAEPVPYVWPLHAPGDVPITRAWPMAEVEGEAQDHPHHRSFWFAHGDVNGVDFWHEGAKRSGRIVNTGRLLEKLDRKKEYLIGLEYAWKSPEDETLLVERRRITFGAEPDFRWIDVEHTFRTPLEEVVFGDTKEGSFALRLHPALRLRGESARGSAVNSEGVTGREVWGKRASWVHYQAPIGEENFGVVIFDHPENPRHPTWWHARNYGLLTANPFGIRAFRDPKIKESGDYTIKKGEILTQRYRLVLHQGTVESAKIEEAWKSFTAEAK